MIVRSLDTHASMSDFYATSALMPDGQSQTIKIEDYLGSYVLLIFYPGDFNPVSKTEILDFAEQNEKFKNNGCQVGGFM